MQCTDPVILNLWHPLAAVAETAVGPVHSSTLLGERVGFVLDALGGVAAWRERSSAPAGGGADPDEVSDHCPHGSGTATCGPRSVPLSVSCSRFRSTTSRIVAT